MQRIFSVSVLLAIAVLSIACSRTGQPLDENNSSTQLKIKDNWYYINGEKFFVNALGYEIGARPGQHPYVERIYSPQRVKDDMAVIKSAGFNAIRTWAELSEEELQEVQKSGLKLVLGIGINPEEDFSDPKVIEKNMSIVKKVLAYSKNYDCVISYLVMNEPLPQHIQHVGAQATVDLWKNMRDLIHQEHPGIHVSISGNSTITEFVDMNVFDVYAYNSYDYDGFNYTHGYANASRILSEMNGQNKPLFITEFGLSVSRDEGESRYGGNTLIEQMNMLPWYYRELLDAGATGASPFYYADGWWKGQEPSQHNDTPEEWFGFWGYSDLEDKVGYPRPVWHAVKQYNSALISSPRNQMFYKNVVPVEIFLQPGVDSIRVLYQDTIVYTRNNVTSEYLNDSISFTGQGLSDRELIFEFYNKNKELMKLESIIVLTGDKDIQWPSIAINTELNDLDESELVAIELEVINDSIFYFVG